MPPAISYILDDRSHEYQALEAAFSKEYDERAARFNKHWEYYAGIMPKPLKIEKDGVNDNVILGKVDQVADKIVSFLLGDGVTFQAGGEEHTEEDDAVEKFWLENRGKTLLHNIALAGSLTGHNAVRLEPREGRMPRIVHINAAHFTAFWDAVDIGDMLWYRLQYRLGDIKGNGKRIDYVKGMVGKEVNHDADGWTEIVYRDEINGRWTETGRKQIDFCPIVDWQNMPRPHVYYGADDISKAVALNDALNFVASNYARILKHHGAPKTIGIGIDASQLVESKVGGFYTTKSPRNEADIYNLEMQSDLTSAREFLSILGREIWQSARMVDPQAVKDTVGALTNFGLRVLYQDALTRTETKRLLYEEAFEQIGKRGLELSGLSAPESITTVWPDVLPEDAVQISTALLKELEASIIDKQTYRELRGYDHEKIEERMQDEKTNELSVGESILTQFARGA